MTPGEKARAVAREALSEAVREAAEKVLERSNASIGIGDPAKDPDPNFALREHGTIVWSEGGLTANVTYPSGGAAGPYSIAQHESVWWKHPRGGKAKFLEDALKDYAPEFPRDVRNRVREALRLGGG